MKITVTPTSISDLVVINVDYFTDDRGYFIEPWHKRDFLRAGLDLEFVQEGHSLSIGKVIRGLHFQNSSAPMAKLVRCIVGEVFEVAVDLRISSPSFGKWFGINLSSENKKLLYVPVGCALGFATITNTAEVLYKQTGYYTPSAEGTVSWRDPDINIKWPYQNPILSKRDKNGMSLSEYIKHPAFP